MTIGQSSRKHGYIILTPLNPTLYSKTGVYRGYTLFFLFLTEAVQTSTHNALCFEQKYEKKKKKKKIPEFFIWKFLDFGGEIFYTFE